MSKAGEAAGVAGQGVIMLLILALGIINVVAIVSLAMDVWGWHWIFAALLAGVLLFLRLDLVAIPLAIWGMIAAWGWPWWVPPLIVFWPLVLAVMVHGVAAVFGRIGQMARAR